MRERTDALPPSHAPERAEVRRFDRSARLLGVSAMERLSRAHVRVFGLGGVGSWAAEALARSGVGHLALVDSDRVCLTDANRQLPALEGSVGRLKAEVVAERLRLINPEAHIEAIAETYGAQTAERRLNPRGAAARSPTGVGAHRAGVQDGLAESSRSNRAAPVLTRRYAPGGI